MWMIIQTLTVAAGKIFRYSKNPTNFYHYIQFLFLLFLNFFDNLIFLIKGGQIMILLLSKIYKKKKKKKKKKKNPASQ